MPKHLVELLTVDDVARAMNWKPATVRQKCWRRQLPYLKIGSSVRFKPEVIERLIEGCEVPAREPR